MFSEVYSFISVLEMPRYSGKVTKSRKGVGGRGKKKIIIVDSSLDACPSTPTPNSIDTRPKKVSSSTKKIDITEYNRYECDGNFKNEIIDINILSEKLQESSLCKNCKKNGLQVRSSNYKGLASKLEIFCSHCDFNSKFISSKEVEVPDVNRKLYDINVRLVYGLRCIGKGKLAGQTLCGILNLPQPPANFLPYNLTLREKCKRVAYESMKAAVEEAVEENKVVIQEEGNISMEANPRDIPAAFDGTWQRRGHRSLNGVFTCTSIDSGKVMDVDVLSKYCLCLDKGNHEANCIANHEGSSGSMEGHGIRNIFNRSIEKYDVRYVKYLGDGDSNSFDSIVANSPYGNTKIEKLECVNHVMKRMGGRLRNLKATSKKQKLDDGKSLGGKNRLTDKKIDQIQSYYGKAIKANKNNLEGMRRAVWAIYCHIGSSDENPEHRLCPEGKESWCKYNKAVAEKKPLTGLHKNTVPQAIMKAIKPTFRALAQRDLLKKCLHGTTQNVNESFNSVIWTRIPKNNFVTMRTLEFGVYEAVASYNDGNITKCKVLSAMGLEPGVRLISAMKLLDLERIRRAEKAISDFLRQARRQERLHKRRLEENEEETPAYMSGMY